MFNDDDYDDDYGFERKKRPVDVSLTPPKFYSIVEVMKTVDKDLIENLDSFVETAGPVLEAIDTDVQSIAQANNDMLQELRISTKKSPFSANQEHDFSNYKHSMSNHNFIRVAYDSVKSIQTGYHTLLAIASDLRPRELVLSNEKLMVGDGKVETIQKMMFEMQLNTSSVRSFISAIERLDNLELSISQIASNNYKILESYYHKLQHRHSVEGVEIFRDAIATDVAISIYENVDHHGEIEDGRKADEVSAYTMRKAELIAKALKNGLLANFITSPPAFFDFIKDNLRALWKNTENLKKLFQSQIDKIKSVLGTKSSYLNKSSKYLFEDTLTILGDLDPRNVVYKEKTVILSSEERYNLKFRNETVAEIVKLLNDKGASVKDIVDYILERKAHLKSFFQDENSFFVCKIGSGNPFLGEAPGGLQVVPSQRPQGKLDDIVGSGFDEVKEFIKTIEHSAKWHDLFQATSPSKTADKSNILLVGPMGCGKTEIMRSVANDKKSIGIFAQGSDFMTCWKGEAQKNPKRLFEAGMKIQRESRKHVHFLIDEIDSVLNDDKEYGSENLSLEFQILMDGVVHYPNLSIWGATNNPERIPMPMIRRFSKVLIVGELDLKDRVHLLKHFVGFLPTDEFNDAAWEDMAKKLEGATGDVVRKVADHLWRTKMSWFVSSHEKEADKLVSELNHGEKFQIGEFNDKARYEFKAKLGKHFAVKPADLEKSIKTHLNNIAIRNEIETAKDTYKRAKQFLNDMNSQAL